MSIRSIGQRCVTAAVLIYSIAMLLAPAGQASASGMKLASKTPSVHRIKIHAKIASTTYTCYRYSTSYQSAPLSFGLSGPVCFNGTNVYAPQAPTPFCSHAWWAPTISCSPWAGGSGSFFDRSRGALTLWANWMVVESIPYPGMPTGSGIPFYPYSRIWVKPNGQWSASSVV